MRGDIEKVRYIWYIVIFTLYIIVSHCFAGRGEPGARRSANTLASLHQVQSNSGITSCSRMFTLYILFHIALQDEVNQVHGSWPKPSLHQIQIESGITSCSRMFTLYILFHICFGRGEPGARRLAKTLASLHQVQSDLGLAVHAFACRTW